LIERVADPTDLGPALGRQVPTDRRQTSHHGQAFRLHVASLLREAGVVGDHIMMAHALLAFVDLETLDQLRKEDKVTAERVKATWADLVRRVTGADR
jgi:hypothetical protein